MQKRPHYLRAKSNFSFLSFWFRGEKWPGHICDKFCEIHRCLSYLCDETFSVFLSLENKVSVSKRWASGCIKIAQSRTVTGFQDSRFSFCGGCHVGTLFLSCRECTLPRRSTWLKCLQGSLTIHGSTSLLMGPTTILIIDVVIDSAVLPPLTGAAEFTCMTLFVTPIPWPFPSHLPSVSEISVILHLSFVICRADRAVFSPLSAGRWCWWTAVRWAYADDEARDAAGRKLH